MEKDYRLFIRNLPINITEARTEELFKKYVTVKNIDLKEKKDLNDKINKFAFINISTTDKDLQTCFSALNGERIDGFEISVELAKESFLERLKRERSECKTKNEKSPLTIKEDHSKSDFFENAHVISKAKHQTFTDTDFSANNLKTEIPITKNNNENFEKEFHSEKISDQENFKLQISKQSNQFEKPKKQIFFNEDGLESEQLNNKNDLKNNNFRNKNADYNKLTTPEITIKPMIIDESKRKQLMTLKPKVLSESEKKRLMSLKQKKQTFKSQEQVIRDALKSIDKNQSNNKIVFDDNIDTQILQVQTKTNCSKKNALFDSDDEEIDKIDWDEVELDVKARVKEKFSKLQTNFGNDKRFVLDERFLDDEDKQGKETFDSQNDTNIEDERKWQLEILGNVLGKSIKPPMADSSDAIKKKNKMIRYDPTAINHQDYEVAVKKSKEEPVKKKKKLITDVVEDVPPIPTSKEVFYDVSDKLVESLKQSEGFSLLKTFGQSTLDTETDKNQLNSEVAVNKGNFHFNFGERNPFKYDSSDEDDANDESNDKTNLTDIKQQPKMFTRQKDDKLFFVYNDPRFQEAEQFFKNQIIQEEGAFKNKRRKLKEIVRSKIRNNLKKKVPWNRRKVRKVQKK